MTMQVVGEIITFCFQEVAKVATNFHLHSVSPASFLHGILVGMLYLFHTHHHQMQAREQNIGLNLKRKSFSRSLSYIFNTEAPARDLRFASETCSKMLAFDSDSNNFVFKHSCHMVEKKYGIKIVV